MEFLREKQMPLVVGNGRCLVPFKASEEKKVISHATREPNVPYLLQARTNVLITNDLNTRESWFHS